MKKLFTFLMILGMNLAAISQPVPVPTGLKASYMETDSINYVKLEWDRKSLADSVTVGYNILVNFPPQQQLLVLSKAGIVFSNSYLYPVKSTKAVNYKFAIMGVANFPKTIRSQATEVVQVSVPSQQLPFVEIETIRLDDQYTVKLDWEYPNDIQDLEGFRIYANGSVLGIADRQLRSWEMKLEDEGKYILELVAFSQSGLESPRSQKKIVKVN